MKQMFRPMLSLFVLLTVVTGVVYPLAMTGVGQVLFPHQANGSLVTQGDKVVGSELIGQTFTSPKYFWTRPSATTPMPYNANNSVGSNLGPTNPAQIAAVKSNIANLQASDPTNKTPIPVDLVTASASGLDPEISPAAAAWQAPRVARERHLSPDVVQGLIQRYTKGRTFGILGEPRVNVLELNLALDALGSGTQTQ